MTEIISSAPMVTPIVTEPNTMTTVPPSSPLLSPPHSPPHPPPPPVLTVSSPVQPHQISQSLYHQSHYNPPAKDTEIVAPLNSLSGDPKSWGPSLWKFLHTMAANFPDHPSPQFKASARQYFYSLRHLLPCPICQTHYTALLSKIQPRVESATEMQEWVLWLHNEVGKRVSGQPSWDVQQLHQTYPRQEEHQHHHQNPEHLVHESEWSLVSRSPTSSSSSSSSSSNIPSRVFVANNGFMEPVSMSLQPYITKKSSTPTVKIQTNLAPRSLEPESSIMIPRLPPTTTSLSIESNNNVNPNSPPHPVISLNMSKLSTIKHLKINKFPAPDGQAVMNENPTSTADDQMILNSFPMIRPRRTWRKSKPKLGNDFAGKLFNDHNLIHGSQAVKSDITFAPNTIISSALRSKLSTNINTTKNQLKNFKNSSSSSSSLNQNQSSGKVCNARRKGGCKSFAQDPKTGVIKKKSCGCGK